MKLMKFSRNMFYESQDVPLYYADKVYEIEDKMVDRWLKRGGVVVDQKGRQTEVGVKSETVDVESKEPIEDTPEKSEDDVKSDSPKKFGKRK